MGVYRVSAYLQMQLLPGLWCFCKQRCSYHARHDQTRPLFPQDFLRYGGGKKDHHAHYRNKNAEMAYDTTRAFWERRGNWGTMVARMHGIDAHALLSKSGNCDFHLRSVTLRENAYLTFRRSGSQRAHSLSLSVFQSTRQSPFGKVSRHDPPRTTRRGLSTRELSLTARIVRRVLENRNGKTPSECVLPVDQWDN